jgi:hypothetical protein
MDSHFLLILRLNFLFLQGLDLAFLQKGILLSSSVVYSMHKTSTQVSQKKLREEQDEFEVKVKTIF